jgi:hypothetical protein
MKKRNSNRTRVKVPPPLLDERQRYTAQQAGALLRQSLSETYRQIAAGAIESIRSGRRVYVPGSEIVRLSTLPPEGERA